MALTKQQMIRELRDPLYPQARRANATRNSEGRLCLCALALIAVQRGLVVSDGPNTTKLREPKTGRSVYASTLVEIVTGEAGFLEEDAPFGQAIIDMNDREEMTFAEIADELEAMA